MGARAALTKESPMKIAHHDGLDAPETVPKLAPLAMTNRSELVLRRSERTTKMETVSRRWRWKGGPRRIGRQIILSVAAFCLITCMAGCSVLLEATKPTPCCSIDMDPTGPTTAQLRVGEKRDAILEKLGAPESSTTESDGSNCDLYHLYTGTPTRLMTSGGPASMILVDLWFLFLPELVYTPMEWNDIYVKGKHPVTICYKNQKMVCVN